MKLRVYARHALVDRPPGPEDPALLLEGSFLDSTISAAISSPAGISSATHRSLDDSIDGRFDWIDGQAAAWAELAAGTGASPEGSGSAVDSVSAAYLNALALRYYLVKLLRLPAYFTEVQPLRAGDCVELIAAASRDVDYADVLAQLCQNAGAHFRARWIKDRQRGTIGFPNNAPWRRLAAWLSRRLLPPANDAEPGRRVVLCGNPRLLEPVCRELLARRSTCWWLYDRFAIKSWLRWRAAGVGQLVCDSSLGRKNRLPQTRPGTCSIEPWECRGVNMAGPVRRWLAERLSTHGRRQTRLVEQIDAHFRRVRPEVLVLDEDATPLARAAVAMARRCGARCLVVQHGVPCCRFGFAPPAADRILVWGRSSEQQLLDWAVPPEQIRVTGLAHKKGPGPVSLPVRGRRAPVPFSVLLLATVPPRDDRPDAVALHLTGRTYARMLRTAFAAVAGMDGAELIVKLHPRAPDDPVVRRLQGEFPSLRSRMVRRGSLEQWLRGIDCVLSCGSSAGVEATLAGVPVIQLAPPGAGGFAPHEPWGLAGTARSETELESLLARVLVYRNRLESEVLYDGPPRPSEQVGDRRPRRAVVLFP